MPDVTTNLPLALQSGDYEIVDGIPIFDAHPEFDKKGNLVRDFDQAKLQKIADYGNQRFASGNPGLIGPGHTRPPQLDAQGVVHHTKETDQPPIYGVLGELKVGRFNGKPTLTARFYMKRQITMPDGSVVTGRQALAEFPRRSIELWPDGLLDWVALLRVSAERDLGVTLPGMYSRALAEAPWSVLKERLYSRDGRVLQAAFSQDGKLRYSMEESPVPDPTLQPDANADPTPDELNPEEAKTADRFAKHYEKNHAAFGAMCKRYAAEAPAAPAGAPAVMDSGSTGIPKGTELLDEDKKLRMSKQGDNRQYAKTIQELQDQLWAERDLNARKDLLAQYERDLRERLADGIELDLAEELADVKDVPTDKLQGACTKNLAKIARHYERSPVGGPMINPRVPTSSRPGVVDEKKADQAMHYMREHNLSGPGAFERAMKELDAA